MENQPGLLNVIIYVVCIPIVYGILYMVHPDWSKDNHDGSNSNFIMAVVWPISLICYSLFLIYQIFTKGPEMIVDSIKKRLDNQHTEKQPKSKTKDMGKI